MPTSTPQSIKTWHVLESDGFIFVLYLLFIVAVVLIQYLGKKGEIAQEAAQHNFRFGAEKIHFIFS